MKPNYGGVMNNSSAALKKPGIVSGVPSAGGDLGFSTERNRARPRRGTCWCREDLLDYPGRVTHPKDHARRSIQLQQAYRRGVEPETS